ncbi:Hydroxyacylglutathione hydrolase GloC [bioreactor metagenome]|uniref:Hydroxyacylglutathione hydrolase GloC n=1 Tax=bioreactor metagenome TaxID=1076179 RepID=A0A645BI11_9ZZZZ
MENFRVIPVGMLAVNCYLVLDEAAERLFVVDPGDDADLIVAAAREMPHREAVILLTHAHVDHIGAVPEVARALKVKTVWLAPGDVPMYGSPSNNLLPYLAAVAGLPPTVSEWPWRDPELLSTPGHSRGGSCFYFRSRKILLSGDTLFAGSVGRTDFPGGDFALLEQGIREKILTLPDEVKVYPGHGPATTVGAERRNNPYLV